MCINVYVFVRSTAHMVPRRKMTLSNEAHFQGQLRIPDKGSPDWLVFGLNRY